MSSAGKRFIPTRGLSTALRYVGAALLPFFIAEVWPGPERAKPIAAYVFFLCIAVTSRYGGIGAGLICMVASAIALWDIVLATTTHGMNIQITRMVLFLASATLVATFSMQVSRRELDTQQRLRALFEGVPDAVLFFDNTGRYIDANPAASDLLGIPREEIVGSHLGTYSRSENARDVQELLARLHVAGRLSGEWTIRRRDGTLREIEYRFFANVLPGVHCVIDRDITVQKIAEGRVHDLSGRLLRLQDEERRRIARELHDNTGQILAAIRLNLSQLRSRITDDPAAKTLGETIQLTDETIAEVRTLSYRLHPPLIDEAGLLPSLRWYLRGFEERSGVGVTLDAPKELEALPLDVATAAFRVIQEALTNVQRHSGSDVAIVRVVRHDGGLEASVEDHGRGLPASLRDNRGALRSASVGVAGMEQRVAELGGTLNIESTDEGTIVRFDIPLAKA